MKRPTPVQSEVVKQLGHADTPFAKGFPQVNQYLTDCFWDDGKAREPSALAFTIKDGVWQVALNDKALKASFYSSAPTMAEALQLLEKALQDGVEAWRPWKRGK